MLVATVLTTALITGAAKGAQAAPANKPQAVSVARRLAAKLATSFRQVVPAARLAPMRVTGDSNVVAAIVPTSTPPPAVPFDSSPALYPLPPPNL
jgi:hypothetical protein